MSQILTTSQCLAKYGDPNQIATQNKWFELWIVPDDIQQAFKHVRFSALGTIGFPKKIFINKDFRPVLEAGLHNLIDRGFANEMKTWDGVFVIRNQRGSASKLSIQAWANAFDVNQSENQLGMEPILSPGFVKCFTDADMDWGGFWKRKDGMHFQLKANKL